MIGIIVGAGRIGYNLAKSLAENHDITIIEKNKEFCEKVSDTLDCYVIQGSGINLNILKEAEVKKADFFVAVTGNDEVNLLSSVYAKDHGVKKIFSRLNNTQHKDIFERLNIKTVNPEESATRLIARSIIRPTVQKLAVFDKGDGEIIEILVKNSDLLYTPISKIEKNTSKFKILTIYSNDDVIIPTNDTEIGTEDRVVILVKSEYVDEIRDYFRLEN